MRQRILSIVLPVTLVWLLCCCGDNGDMNPVLARILSADKDSCAWCSAGVPAPDTGCQRLRTRPIGGSLGMVFKDLNDAHLEQARATGIIPVTDFRSSWQNTRGIVEIRSCSLYYVDDLKYSHPYLTRDAADLLRDICSRFRDTLKARGGGAYRPKVTSALRTKSSSGRLRRVNRNATSESAHCFATTFDLSYSKFICDSSTGVRRTFEDLKNLLGEVIADLRKQGRCLVKHERRQACFHITVCMPDSTQALSYDTK